MTEQSSPETSYQELEKVVICFAGDSGDGMQLTGNQFTQANAIFGNDIATLPDFPAEIRAPAGTVAGVSGFQLQFGSMKINTPGEETDVLVAMNPAGLKANIDSLKKNGLIIIDEDAFNQKNIAKAGYQSNPLEDDSLSQTIFKIPVTKQTAQTLSEMDMSGRAKSKCRNFFTLGVIFWLFDRSPEFTITWLKNKFAKKPMVAEANIKALKEGMIYADVSGLFQSRYTVQPAKQPKGTYKNITGNQATGLALAAVSERSKTEVFYGTYPITPATDILHEVAKYKNFKIKTFQAEDEIAAICSAIGASYAGSIGVTGSSGPGIALKTEAIGLATIIELPLVIINVMRGGPSTGLPTKAEQADLFQAIHGRPGECPVPIVAAKSPQDCFYQFIEAARIAIKYMTPVFFLSDGYLANGSEPFRIPDVDTLPDLTFKYKESTENFQAYERNEKTLAREWVKIGTPGLTHRVGGLEKDILNGNINYEPDNHEKMIRIRQQKVDGIENDIAPLEIFGDQEGGEVLIVGWGSTYGAITNKVIEYRENGKSVSHVHFTHLNPFPKNTSEVLKKFKHVVVAEKNLGQLNSLLRAKYMIETISINKPQAKPFRSDELGKIIDPLLS